MDYNDKLKTLHEKIEGRKRLEEELKLLDAQIAELNSKWFTLKENFEKEVADVKELEGKSIVSLMARLSGRLEEQLEKEQREAKTAQREYETAETSLRAGKVRMAEIVSELEILREENIALPGSFAGTGRYRAFSHSIRIFGRSVRTAFCGQLFQTYRHCRQDAETLGQNL